MYTKLSLPLTTQMRDNCASLRDGGTLCQNEGQSLAKRDGWHVCVPLPMVLRCHVDSR